MAEIKRLCLGCNNLFNIKDLIKIKLFEKKIIINPKHYISGRGAYLCYNMECMNKAKRSKRLEKSFKGNLKVTEEVWQLLNVVLEAVSEKYDSSKGISFYGK
ncbi:MAG: YlxR family protein [Candidatus Sericytochromatia bacterium]